MPLTACRLSRLFPNPAARANPGDARLQPISLKLVAETCVRRGGDSVCVQHPLRCSACRANHTPD